MDLRACPLRTKLEQQIAAAETAYRDAAARMKQTRGKEFERAWRLTEHRRASLQRAHQALQDHDQDHSCRLRECVAAGN